MFSIGFRPVPIVIESVALVIYKKRSSMPRSEQTLTSKVNQDNRTDSWYELGNKSEAGGLTTIEVASNRFPFLIEIRLKKEREREKWRFKRWFTWWWLLHIGLGEILGRRRRQHANHNSDDNKQHSPIMVGSFPRDLLLPAWSRCEWAANASQLKNSSVVIAPSERSK